MALGQRWPHSALLQKLFWLWRGQVVLFVCNLCICAFCELLAISAQAQTRENRPQAWVALSLPGAGKGTVRHPPNQKKRSTMLWSLLLRAPDTGPVLARQPWGRGRGREADSNFIVEWHWGQKPVADKITGLHQTWSLPDAQRQSIANGAMLTFRRNHGCPRVHPYLQYTVYSIPY